MDTVPVKKLTPKDKQELQKLIKEDSGKVLTEKELEDLGACLEELMEKEIEIEEN